MVGGIGGAALVGDEGHFLTDGEGSFFVVEDHEAGLGEHFEVGDGFDGLEEERNEGDLDFYTGYFRGDVFVDTGVKAAACAEVPWNKFQGGIVRASARESESRGLKF